MAMNMMQSILDKTGLGGFRTGVGDYDQQIHSDQDMADKQLLHRRTQNLLDNEILDNPVKAIKRAQEIAAGESDTADILAGGRDRDRENKRSMDVAALLEKQDSNKRKQIEDAATAAVRAASIFKEDDTPLLRQQKWAEAYRIGQDGGLKNMPQEYSEYNYQQLQLRAKAAPMTVQQIQAMQSADQKFKHDTQLNDQKHGQTLEVTDVNNEASMDRQRLQSNTTMAAARLREAGENARQANNPVLTKSKEVVAAKGRVDAAIKGEGEASLLDFESVAANDYGAAVKRNTDILKIDAEKRIESLNQQIRMNEGDPKKVAAYEAQIEKVANKLRADIEQTSFPAAFRKKYDEIRRREYGSIDAAPVSAAIEKAMTTPAGAAPESIPSVWTSNSPEAKAARAAEDTRVSTAKATPEYLALQSEYNSAIANRNQTEARSIKAQMDAIVNPKPTPAAPAAKSGRTEVNRGVRKSDGKTVILYSDGTKEVQ